MKLHIGSGERYLPGYKHLDIIKREHIDYACDARDLSFLQDGCADEIYACHVLEHFKRGEVESVLTEWNRILRMPGGALRVCVPNFEAIMREYTRSENLETLLGLLYGGQNNEFNFHFQAYDFKRLKMLLEKTGYIDVQEYDSREFLPPGYDDYSRAYLPHMDFEGGRPMSLNILAMKG